jgi:hypothetical protein
MTAATAPAPTVSSLLAQVHQAASANMTTLNTAFQDAKNAPNSDNLPSTNEIQVLGGQILFQQKIDSVLNSLPASVWASNESDPGLIGLLELLLPAKQ